MGHLAVIDSERGKIRNKEHVPTKDFSGLRYGKITPTDIDGGVEFNDKVFVFIELKYRNAVIKTGQRLFLERLCDALEVAGKVAIVLMSRYQTTGDTIVDVAPLPVSDFRMKGEWHKPKKEITIRQAIDEILTWHPAPKDNKKE